MFSKSKKKKKKQRRNNKDNASSDEETDEMKQQLEEELVPEEEISTEPISKTNKISETPIILQCFVCKEEFSSRNALFKHIKELDHAKPIQVKTKNKKK